MLNNDRRRAPTPFFALALAAAAAASGCKTATPAGSGLREDDAVTATAAPLDPTLAAKLQSLGMSFQPVSHVEVDVGNSTAYWSKADAVEKATKSIDVAYFLFGEDYAGSHFGKLLAEKAAAGVKVRIMVDAKTAMNHRPYFRALVAKGAGNLRIAYFRPVPQVIYRDLETLGFDPEAFVNAFVMADTASVGKQITVNQTLKANAALLKDVVALVHSLLQPTASDGIAAQPVPEVANIDAAVVARVVGLAVKLKEAHAALNLKASGRDWFDITKWTHHKLLLIDGSIMQGGGRNMEDAYHWEKDHPIRMADPAKHYVFMDVDYRLDSLRIAKAALATYDAYWNGACFTEPPVPGTCTSGIPMAEETNSDMTAWEEIERKSAALVAARNTPTAYVPVHSGVFKQDNVQIAYAENRMFPGDGSGSLITEEPSRHNAALVAMIDTLKPGQDIVFQNAYLYFPSNMQVALMRAMKRGVNVVVQSNSPESSDLGYVAQAARLQYSNFLRMMQDPAVKGRFEIYEYLTEESLHAKVEIIGDRWLVVGSINADPRCEYLDTNNGIIIDSPELAKTYKDWLARLRTDLLARSPAVLRRVDDARLAVEALTPPTDPIVKGTLAFQKLADKTFEDSPMGERARLWLQAVFLQY